MQCFAPDDFMEQLLIKELADGTWEVMRYTRHKPLAIERKSRQHREFQAKRAMALVQQQDAQARKVAADNREPATEIGRMLELEHKVDSTIADVDAILDEAPVELDHARALEAGIVYHLQLDQLYNAAIARRNDTLDQLERYRRGSSKRLRKASEEIIDAEFKAVAAEPKDEAAPLVPSSESGQ